MKALSCLLILLLHLDITSASTILFFLFGTNAYDRHLFEFVAQQVALRNHNTITVKPILIPEEPRLVAPRLHLVHEKFIKNLLPKPLYEPLQSVGGDVPWRKTYELDAYNEPLWRAHNHSCEKLLNSNLMSSLKRDQVEVAVLHSGNPCQLAIVHALGIPFIYFDLEGLTDETIIASGTPWNLNAPTSRITPQVMAATQNRHLLQFYTGIQLVRESICQSAWMSVGALMCPRVRQLDEPISRAFADDYDIRRTFKAFPHVNWIKQNAELYFVNTDPLIEPHYTALPSHVIPVGGAHIDHPRPLFSPWNTSVGASQPGMIIVQMGANVDSSKMPAHLVRAFIGAFIRLKKYRIYWRIGTTLQLNDVDLDSLPDHINVTTYLPQNDLLANKRTKLLITNGGMSSVMEATYHGVPMLGIPLYGVNYQNLLKAQQKGVALLLDKDAINEKKLYAAIKQVLENPKFERTSREMAKELRERPYTAFDVLLKGIEHVARHRSAKFLSANDRPKGVMLFLRVSNLDFFTIFTLTLIFCIFVAYKLLRFLLSCIACSKKSANSKKSPTHESKKNR